jgi:UDP-N-acetyl-D-mannosaminuronic acid dehydrogenase
VCVVGLGRVGLPLALLAARAGMTVTGAERDPSVRALARGERSSPEPGLDALVREVAQTGRLAVGEAPVAARTSAVCVGTPLGPDRTADLQDLDAALAQLDAVAPPDGLILLSVTVPVGTTERAAGRLRQRAPGRQVACCPERVLPGDLLREMVELPRLAGGVDEASTEAAARWLERLVQGPVLRVSSRMAELAKLLENAARDVELALAHTAAEAARRHGLDPHELRAVVNHHPRVKLLVPGPGVGGHCLPVDPWFLVSEDPDGTALLRVAREVNDAVTERWIERIAQAAAGRRLGLLGLTYKPDTDDVRHSPALRIAQALAERFDVVVHDPYVQIEGLPMAPLPEVLQRELVVLLVAHREYRALGAVLAGRAVIDTCGGW